MSINTLPQELISLIMDYLSDDRESLKAASLISPIFLPTCQSHLFKRLCMSSFNPVFDYQCSAWADILRRSSNVLQYVKVLEIGPPLLRSRSRSFWSTRLLGDTPSEDTHRPSINDSRLESILAGIIHPQSVALRFQLSQWRNISPSLRKEISRLISQESLTSLSLEDVNDFPLEVLQDCRSLLHLSLVSVQPFPSKSIVEHRPSNNTGFLDTLMLMTSDECIEALIHTLSASRSRLCLSRLRMICINIGLQNGPDILQKISCAVPNISSITLRFIDHISNTGLSPNTTHAWEAYNLCHPKAFPTLRSLIISASYSRHSRPIRALASFLSTFGPQSTLEALTLHFRTDVPRQRFQSRTHADSLERMCSHADWRLVEAQCMVAGRFPSLRKLTLAFRPKDVGMGMSPYFDQTLPLCLMNVMPNLYALMSPTIALLEDPFEGYQYGMDTRNLGGALHPTFHSLPRGTRRDVVEPSGESAKGVSMNSKSRLEKSQPHLLTFGLDSITLAPVLGSIWPYGRWNRSASVISYSQRSIFLLAEDLVVYIQLARERGNKLFECRFIALLSFHSIKVQSQTAFSVRRHIKKGPSTHGLITISSTAFSAESLKSIISTDTAWWRSASALRSEVGMRGVPWSPYFLAI